MMLHEWKEYLSGQRFSVCDSRLCECEWIRFTYNVHLKVWACFLLSLDCALTFVLDFSDLFFSRIIRTRPDRVSLPMKHHQKGNVKLNNEVLVCWFTAWCSCSGTASWVRSWRGRISSAGGRSCSCTRPAPYRHHRTAVCLRRGT